MNHMRAILISLPCVWAALGTTAQAQPMYGYPPPPHYQPPRESPVPVRGAMLAEHNAVRARLGLPPLVWSDTLAESARDWGNRLLATGAFEHRPGNRYGENLYMITGGYASPAQVMSAWAGESRDYNIRTNTCSGMCGHYTQVVWRTTRSVGCAAVSGRGREVWVCEYDPPGNWVGSKPY